MASHRPSVFAIIKAILHAIAAILAILLLPYLVFCTINGRGVGYVIVAYVAAGWSFLWNIFEAATLASSKDKRLYAGRPDANIRIAIHVITLLLLLVGILVLFLSQWGQGTSDDKEFRQQDNTLSTIFMISGSLACGFHLMFSIFACVDCCRGRRRSRSRSTLNGASIPLKSR